MLSRPPTLTKVSDPAILILSTRIIGQERLAFGVYLDSVIGVATTVIVLRSAGTRFYVPDARSLVQLTGITREGRLCLLSNHNAMQRVGSADIVIGIATRLTE